MRASVTFGRGTRVENEQKEVKVGGEVCGSPTHISISHGSIFLGPDARIFTCIIYISRSRGEDSVYSVRAGPNVLTTPYSFRCILDACFATFSVSSLYRVKRQSRNSRQFNKINSHDPADSPDDPVDFLTVAQDDNTLLRFLIIFRIDFRLVRRISRLLETS